MAEFHGFTCEGCGNVWTLDKRTKVTMRFEQTEFCSLGAYTRDLCPNCIAEPFGWIPSKRNRTHDNEPRHSRTTVSSTTAPFADLIAEGVILVPFEGAPEATPQD